MFPMEIDVDDSWNAYNADAAFGPRPLYPAPGDLIVNNYPPLSFYLIGSLAKLGLDATYVGRALSLLGAVVSSAAAAICIRQLGGKTSSALLGGPWMLATMARFYDGYVGVNDPHLPAIALTTSALAWFLVRHGRGKAAEPAVILMAVAGFYKHTLIATPLSALIWLASICRRASMRAALIGAAVSALGFGLCVTLFGTAFIDQLMFVREYSPLRPLNMSGRLQWIAPGLVLWTIWALRAPASVAKRFTQIYIPFSLAAFLLQSVGEGVGDNSQFELVAACAIGLGLAFEGASLVFGQRLGAVRSKLAILAVLIARLLFSTRMEAYLLLASPQYRALFPAAAQVVTEEAARVRVIPGPVVCSNAAVCRLAGKPFVLDRFAMEQRIRTGRLTRPELEALVQAAGIREERIDPRASVDSLLRRE